MINGQNGQKKWYRDLNFLPNWKKMVKKNDQNGQKKWYRDLNFLIYDQKTGRDLNFSIYITPPYFRTELKATSLFYNPEISTKAQGVGEEVGGEMGGEGGGGGVVVGEVAREEGGEGARDAGEESGEEEKRAKFAGGVLQIISGATTAILLTSIAHCFKKWYKMREGSKLLGWVKNPRKSHGKFLYKS